VEFGPDGGDGLRVDMIDAGGGFFVTAKIGARFADALEDRAKDVIP
jgi:hypothetical protein